MQRTSMQHRGFGDDGKKKQEHNHLSIRWELDQFCENKTQEHDFGSVQRASNISKERKKHVERFLQQGSNGTSMAKKERFEDDAGHFKIERDV